MENKYYLISVAVAIALGYTAGFATDGIIAQAAIPMEYSDDVEKAMGDTAKASWETFLTNQLCDRVTAKFGTILSKCNAEYFKKFGASLQWDSDKGKWVVRAHISVPGTYVPNE